MLKVNMTPVYIQKNPNTSVYQHLFQKSARFLNGTVKAAQRIMLFYTCSESGLKYNATNNLRNKKKGKVVNQ